MMKAFVLLICCFGLALSSSARVTEPEDPFGDLFEVKEEIDFGPGGATISGITTDPETGEIIIEFNPATPKDESAVDYRCSEDGGGIDIDTDAKKVWLTDPDLEDGQELTVTRFDVARCPHCFSIEAELALFGTKLIYQLNMNAAGFGTGDSKHASELNVTISSPVREDKEEFKFNCEFVSN